MFNKQINMYSMLFILFALTVIHANANLESCTTPSSESGLCVPYRECPFVKELIQNYGSYEAIPKYYLKQVLKSKCSLGDEAIRLCCKMSDNYKSSPVIPKTKPTLTEDLDPTKDIKSQFNPEGIKILNQFECGSHDGDRVAGGGETELGEFPWMALLRYDAPGDEFKCSGSLITNLYVLTTAHCVDNSLYPVIGVRLGEHNLTENPDCKVVQGSRICMPPVEDFGIEKVITHPSYSARRLVNDIALVKLDRPVEFKIHIKPICLPITKPSYESHPNKFTIAGWGGTKKPRSSKSNVLLKAENMTREENNDCERHYAAVNIQITQKHLCVADLSTNRDSCKGDSGGPLFVLNDYAEDKNSKKFVQYGILAAGPTDCKAKQKFSDIYTNVLTFLPWITNNIVY